MDYLCITNHINVERKYIYIIYAIILLYYLKWFPIYRYVDIVITIGILHNNSINFQ